MKHEVLSLRLALCLGVIAVATVSITGCSQPPAAVPPAQIKATMGGNPSPAAQAKIQAYVQKQREIGAAMAASHGKSTALLPSGAGGNP